MMLVGAELTAKAKEAIELQVEKYAYKIIKHYGHIKMQMRVELTVHLQFNYSTNYKRDIRENWEIFVTF